MTGFGRGEASENGLTVTCEIRTVNNRFFDFTMRAPRTLMTFENELRELSRSRIVRGKVLLSLSEERGEDTIAATRLDSAAARRIARELSGIADNLGIKEPITLQHLLHFPDLVTPVTDPAVTDLLLKLCRSAAEAALEDLRKMRAAEGENLAKDILERTGEIERALQQIEDLRLDIPTRAMEKLRERIRRLTVPEAYDEYRLEMEIAMLADRLDVTEECVRLKGHIEAFRRTLEADRDSVGKRLGFLLQEMNREANTIGSKISELEISHLCVRIKEEIEKIREQVQNLE